MPTRVHRPESARESLALLLARCGLVPDRVIRFTVEMGNGPKIRARVIVPDEDGKCWNASKQEWNTTVVTRNIPA